MRRRILVSILTVIAATVVALGLPLAVLSHRLVADLMRQELATRLDAISETLTIQAAQGADVSVDMLARQIPSEGRLKISMPGHNEQVVGEAISGDVLVEKLVLAGGGELKLAVPADSVRSAQWEALGLVGLAVLVSILVGTVIAVITARRLATPLTVVANRAARLGSGDFRASHTRFGIAELDRVLDVLDSSGSDIAALIHRERDLASDISHQLRTRLTGLRLRLEELSTYPDEEVVTEVTAALEQTDRLVTVVDDLLENARSRRAAGATALVLADELTELAAEWRDAFDTADRALIVNCPDDIVVHATAVRIREAIGVLVDNALRHGDGPVDITARYDGSLVMVEVADQGEGIAEALVGHIFDRGISTGDSTGIGLGLARALIESDGGRLELRRARPPIFGVFLARGA